MRRRFTSGCGMKGLDRNSTEACFDREGIGDVLADWRAVPLKLLRWPFVTTCLVVLFGLSCDPSESASAELKASLDASTNVTAKVTYDTVFAYNDAKMFGAIVIAQRPPDRRVDVAFDGVAESVLLKEGKLIQCAEDICRSSNEDPEGSVLDRLVLADYLLGFRDAPLEEVIQGGTVDALPDRQIAGVEGECFEIKAPGVPPDSQTLAEICFSSGNGVLLLLDFQYLWDARGVSFEATSVRDEVTDADLALPSPYME